MEILPNTKNTKTSKLNLINPNFDCDPDEHRIHEDLDDPWDYVKLWHHYNEHCLPHPDSGIDIGEENRFFRRVAPDKVLKKRMAQGITFTAGLESGQLIGKTYFPKLMKEIARECGFVNPERQTSASLRSEHICTLVNAEENIDSTVVMRSSRHKSESAHNCYKRKSKEQLDRKSSAFHAEKNKVLVVSILYFLYINIIINYSYSFLSLHIFITEIKCFYVIIIK